MARRSSWLLLLALAACGDSSSDPGPCRRRAAAIAEGLRAMNHEPAMFYTGDATLVTRADLAQVQLPSAPAVRVTADGVSVDSWSTPSRMDLAERLAMTRIPDDGRPATRGFDPALVHLIVDEDVTWETVVWVTVAVHDSGYTRPAFAFRVPVPEVKPPPRSKVDAELDELMASDDASNKATRLARIASRVIERCKPLGEAFGSVASGDGESKADTLINAIEPSLTRCNCNIDVASFHSLMFRLLYVADATTSLRVTLDPEGLALTFPGSTPWKEVAPKLAAGQRIWLAAQ